MIRTETMLLLLLVTFVCDSANATTIHVPVEFSTIQGAIDSAVDGDVILVAAGTYSGPGFRNVDFGGKSIELRSEMGPDYTIIDLAGWAPGFHFQSGETRECVVDGFTITGGESSGSGPGIRCVNNSSPTIRNCAVLGNAVDNLVYARGGGIYCEGSSPLIESCTVASNTAIDDSAFWTGGGVYATSGSSVHLLRCVIWGNCQGDIVVAGSTSEALVECCIVDPDNTSGDGIVYVGGNGFADPGFCNATPRCNGSESLDPFRYSVIHTSPALPGGSPCGELVGAFGVGCPVSSVPGDQVPGSIGSTIVLSGPSPNPVAGSFSYTLVLDETVDVQVDLFDALGRRAMTLYSGVLPSGRHDLVSSRPQGVSGNSLPAGVYWIYARSVSGAANVQSGTLRLVLADR